MQIARLRSSFGNVRTEIIHSLTIQATGGTRATIDAIKDHVREFLPEVNRIQRSVQPISALRVALQCGGSDGFSSITANPALGFASDLIVGHGVTAILSETPEIYGAEQLLNGIASLFATPDLGYELMHEDIIITAAPEGLSLSARDRRLCCLSLLSLCAQHCG